VGIDSTLALDAGDEAVIDSGVADDGGWTDLGPILDCDGGDGGFFVAIDDGGVARVFTHGCDVADALPPNAYPSCWTSGSGGCAVEIFACEGVESIHIEGFLDPGDAEIGANVRLAVNDAGIAPPIGDAYFGSGRLKTTLHDFVPDAPLGPVGGVFVFVVDRGDTGVDSQVGIFSGRFCVAYPVR
jgi:hypothetical protein